MTNQMKQLWKNPNIQSDLPAPIKAKVTQFANAVHDFAWRGAQHPEDAVAIEQTLMAARYNLERTIETYLEKRGS